MMTAPKHVASHSTTLPTPHRSHSHDDHMQLHYSLIDYFSSTVPAYKLTANFTLHPQQKFLLLTEPDLGHRQKTLTSKLGSSREDSRKNHRVSSITAYFTSLFRVVFKLQQAFKRTMTAVSQQTTMTQTSLPRMMTAVNQQQFWCKNITHRMMTMINQQRLWHKHHSSPYFTAAALYSKSLIQHLHGEWPISLCLLHGLN